MRKAVLYDSNTGNTEAMAVAVAEGARGSGAYVYLARADEADIETMLSCDVIYLGCPAMGIEQPGDAQTDLMAEVRFGFEGRRVALFGSCRSGSGMWLRRWSADLQAYGADVFNHPGLVAVLRPSAEVLERCRDLGAAFSDE